MGKNDIIISEKKLIDRLFKKTEIRSIDHVNYIFTKRKKIIVFVPKEALEDITLAMASKGAGRIGNYEVCSFRIKGIGTYRPNTKAKPYKGKQNRIEHAEETRLEMECGDKDLNNVIDIMLKTHPYEETAYEIHEFHKRSNRTDGIIVELKKPMKINNLITRLNKSLESPVLISGSIRRLGISMNQGDENTVSRFKEMKADHLLVSNKNNFSINKIA